MKVQLMGAAQAVTGSCYIITTANARFAIDCGMHQGSSGMEKRNFNTSAYNASELDFILVTHAHIDHSGLLPRLVKEGFTGPIYCTEATKALLGIMLQDSAHIQEMEAEWTSRKLLRQGEKPIDPLYTLEDAENTLQYLRSTSYNTTFEPTTGVAVTYRDAGHILGSAFLELAVTEPEGTTKVIFSGDLGRPNALLMNDPSIPKLKADYLFLESTYGDRDHKNEDTSMEELAAAIEYSSSRGEKTIFPAFAVERTQEIIMMLHLLYKAGKLPVGIPIYVDSPLAVRATKIFRDHPEYMDKDFTKHLQQGVDPFSIPGLRYITDVKGSQEINETPGPGIIISASGMCNAGRIKHHLRHNLYREGAAVVFTGYQGVGTPGRKLVDGAKTLNLFGELVYVKAKIFTIGGFSGHAGQSQILQWVEQIAHPDLRIVLIHGEIKAQQTLAKLLQSRFGITPTIPAYLEELELAHGKAVVVHPCQEGITPPQINWDMLYEVTEQNVERLKKSLPQVRQRQWPEQVDLRDQLLEMNRQLLHLLSQM